MITGNSKREIRNDLARIADPNSVEATTPIFLGLQRFTFGL
jgi:hypothetical protein